MTEKPKKIEFNLIDFPFEDDENLTAFYKGREFTGILFEKHNGNYFEYEYLNGLENGRAYGINESTKKIIEDGNFLNGLKEGKYYRFLVDKQIDIEEYFLNDLLQEQKVFDSKKVLLKYYSRKENVDREFYNNGTLFFERQSPALDNTENGNLFYFLENESLCKRFEYNDKKSKYRFEFNKSNFLNHTNKLNSIFHWYPVRWFIDDLLVNDKPLAFEFLMQLLNQEDHYFVGESAFYLGELGNKDAIPYLKKIVTNENVGYVYPRIADVKFGALSITCSHANTNGQRAKDAINKIKKKNSFIRRVLR
ncbi:hypothetical protein [uncultured Aquimarina sp.]|uniref:hypothetical protein n=1 Tax=uncultured Aquimarina sp. TaxID=575652 RepID=UPI0026228E32|nr:hypothetical protein [uncultured Aquimarina sp.]